MKIAIENKELYVNDGDVVTKMEFNDFLTKYLNIFLRDIKTTSRLTIDNICKTNFHESDNSLTGKVTIKIEPITGADSKYILAPFELHSQDNDVDTFEIVWYVDGNSYYCTPSIATLSIMLAQLKSKISFLMSLYMFDVEDKNITFIDGLGDIDYTIKCPRFGNLGSDDREGSLGHFLTKYFSIKEYDYPSFYINPMISKEMLVIKIDVYIGNTCKDIKLNVSDYNTLTEIYQAAVNEVLTKITKIKTYDIKSEFHEI